MQLIYNEKHNFKQITAGICVAYRLLNNTELRITNCDVALHVLHYNILLSIVTPFVELQCYVHY